MQLMAVLNVSHQFSEAAAALRVTGERVPPLVTAEIERFGDAILDDRGPGSGMLGSGMLGSGMLGSGMLGSGGRSAAAGTQLPVIPPAVVRPRRWALALRDAMVNLVRVLSGNWTQASAMPAAGAAEAGVCSSGCARGRSGSSSS